MNGLAKALKALASKDVDLNEVADVLEKHAQETSRKFSSLMGDLIIPHAIILYL